MPSIRQSIRSSTASKRPTSAIADGQIALNTASGTPGMFFKDSAGNIVKTGPAHYGASAPNSSPAVGGSTGNSIGEAWLDVSLTPAGWKIWNGSAWVNATPLSSDTVQGLVELATNAETQAGVDAARVVTAASLQSKVSDSISTTSASGIASSTAVKTAYDLANAALPKSGGIVTGNLEIGSTGSFTFEGSTADGFETTLAVVDPTADRTITFPNTTGTVVTTGDAGTVTSTMILDGTILNADINASAAIAGSKIVAATTSVVGAVQLSDSTSTTSSVLAATPTAVKAAYDLANAALPKTGGTVTGNINLDNQVDARFYEATANGTNYVGFQAPASIAADVLWTLPATDGTAAQVLSTNGSGTLSWASTAGGTSISVGNTSATVTDTGTDGKFTVVTEGNTALTISAQATLFGAGFTTALNYYSVAFGGSQSLMDGQYVAGGGSSIPAGPLLWSYGNGAAPAACELTFLRTKSNVSTDLTGQTAANDALGYVNFIGTDGTNTRPCASFQAYSEIAILSASSPGRLVFGTTTAGTTVISEKLRITNGGTIAYNQPTPTSKSAAATLTVAELQTGIIEYTGVAATLTLPTGTLTEGGFAGIYTNMAFQWSVINTGSGICTIGAGTAHTIVGSATIAIGASAQFASRRTAANTFVSYRLS
jgi:hypothetical protein